MLQLVLVLYESYTHQCTHRHTWIPRLLCSRK